jgi:hypothetical protein
MTYAQISDMVVGIIRHNWNIDHCHLFVPMLNPHTFHVSVRADEKVIRQIEKVVNCVDVFEDAPIGKYRIIFNFGELFR